MDEKKNYTAEDFGNSPEDETNENKISADLPNESNDDDVEVHFDAASVQVEIVEGDYGADQIPNYLGQLAAEFLT